MGVIAYCRVCHRDFPAKKSNAMYCPECKKVYQKIYYLHTKKTKRISRGTPAKELTPGEIRNPHEFTFDTLDIAAFYIFCRGLTVKEAAREIRTTEFELLKFLAREPALCVLAEKYKKMREKREKRRSHRLMGGSRNETNTFI